MFKKTIFSLVEDDYLLKHREYPINQLCIALAKTRYAINKRLGELDGKPLKKLKKAPNRSKIGKRKDCNNQFFRSAWEANVYRLLKTDKNIKLIEYEPTDFTFWQFGIKKGTVSYTPDFRVTYKDGKYEYIEVKGGWLKGVDKTKIRRFKKFYPEEFKHLVAVTPGPTSKTVTFFEGMNIEIKWYYPELNKKYRKEIKFWE